MFSGGGLGWAEAAMKRGVFAVAAAPAGTQPDLAGLSCRFEEIPSARGLILSVLVVPTQAADPLLFRQVIEDVIRLVEKSPDAGRPVPPGGPPLRWPPQGVEYEARAARGGPLFARRSMALALGDRLARAASDRIVRYGLHRQDAAMMTCFTPSVMRSDHVHFIDGARGGYASAATALKAMAA